MYKRQAQVSFSLGLEGNITTRAISDGKTADELVYAVFDGDGNRISAIDKVEQTNVTFPTTATITLAKGQAYKVAFWAQNSKCEAYAVSEDMSVTVDYEGANNDETRDAFFSTAEFTVSTDQSIDVTLKRPFAQINVGVTNEDWEAAKASGIEIKKSQAVIEGVANSIKLLDGSVSGETDVTYEFADIPEEELTVNLKSGSATYKYLSMSYILAEEKSTTVPLTFTFKPESGSDIVFNEGLNNVPVQRNWRTNIIGKLLTGDIEFNINIDPIYSGNFNSSEGFTPIADGVSLDEANSTYYLSSKEGLKWFAEQTNNASKDFNRFTVKLDSDVDLAGETWTPIGTNTPFRGTFDGGNRIIRNLTVNVTDDNKPVGLFATAEKTVKNVKLSNVKIQGHYKAGAIVGDACGSKIENCHVDGGTITSTPGSTNDNANNVGGIAGYLSAEPEAWVKDCSVKNLTVTAYRNVGGIVGTVNFSAVVSGNIIDNVKVIADQLAIYADSSKADEPKQDVGRNVTGTATISENTINNVTVKVYTVDNNKATAANGKQVEAAIALGATTINLEEGDYGTITAGTLNDVVIEGNGNTLIFKTDAQTNIQKATLKNVNFVYDKSTADCGVVVNADATIENLVIENCDFIGTGEKAGRGFSGQNDNANITIKDCTFKDLGYPIYAWGSYESLTIENCTFENIKSWAIMPQSGFDGDLTVTGCNFNNCKGGGLIKAGTLTAGHTFTFTKNTVTGCTVSGDHNWFQFDVSAGSTSISENTKDSESWTPTSTDGLKGLQ